VESRDAFYSVDNSRNILENSGVFYPVAHSRNLGEHIRVLRIATSPSPRVYTNQSVTGNQRNTVILK
jgi:hypothetical protein